MVGSVQLIMAVFLFLPCLSQGQTQPATGNGLWEKINVFPVCFEGRGNKPGELNYLGSNALVGAMKLVHKCGTIRCTHNEAFDSKWGCNVGSAHPLNVIITDKRNNIVYPLKKYVKHPSGLWYYLPFTDTVHSKELVFTNYRDPFYLSQYSTLRVWYGEDLRNYHESDNIGRVCVDVYVHAL